MRLLPLALCLAPLAAKADPPKVVTDIAPLHSLAAQVMDGVAEPEFIVTPGTSPHSFALRPSQAQMLQEADLVLWMGPKLTPAMESTIEALSDEAQVIDLMRQPETLSLPFRGAAIFVDTDDDHDDHGHDDHDDHGHEDADHDEHDHEEHAHEDAGHDDHDEHGHDEHGHDDDGHDDHGHEDAHDHDHTGTDPHAWLDPENARIWIQTIADALVYQDPDNAAAYRANAARASENLIALTTQLDETLTPVRGQRYLVFHDAYQYFEARFGLNPTGAVTGGDAAPASAARLSELAALVGPQNIRCALSEPQFSAKIVEQAIGQGVRVTEIDPLASAREPGPALYAHLLEDMAAALVACTKPGE